MIIGICGARYAGKSTFAGIMANFCPVVEYELSKPMYNMLQVLGFDIHVPKDEVQTRFGVTLRHALQTIGTEWGRNKIRSDIWTSLADEQVVRHGSIVSAGIRFPNEVEWIGKNGGLLVNIERLQGQDYEPDHVSDDDMSEYANIIIQNDAGLSELQALAELVFANAQQLTMEKNKLITL